jgi:signal transduction histidine kinase
MAPIMQPSSASDRLERMTRIARIAARLFGVAGAAIGLDEGAGMRLQACTGIPETERERCTALCAAAALAAETMVADTPGFLAAVSLDAADAGKAASLCLFDPAPRPFGDGERALLRDLATTAEEALAAAAQARFREGGLPGPAAQAPAAGQHRLNYLVKAAHEMRTPLASIIGFSELLLKREFDTAGRQELLEIVHAQARRMLQVTNGVFELARIEAGGAAALRIAPTAIDGVLVQALGSVAALGQNDRVRLEVAPGLAPLAADSSRLAQAFGIVLDNALRYSAPGSPVTMRAWAAPGHGVAVEIRDAGPGMAPEVRERLFEPFYRGPGALAVQSTGQGLGMAIFKEIMDLHDAHIDVDSAPDAGTALSILLPLSGPGAGDRNA